MFRRLSNSLLSPKEVAKYYGESFGKTFLFLLIMLLLLMVVTCINLFTTSVLTENMKKEIKKSFVNEQIEFVIEEGQLRNINNDSEYIYTNKISETMYIVFTEDVAKSEVPKDGLSIVFSKDGVYLKYQFVLQIFEYNEYEYLKNIDFSDEELLSDINFWDKVFGITESVLNEYKPIYLVVNTLYFLMYWVGIIMVIVLITSVFSMFRTNGLLSFGSLFKLSIYNITPFIMCLIFSTLFNLGFLVYVGYIITTIYNFITINEVLKRLYLNRKEGE